MCVRGAWPGGRCFFFVVGALVLDVALSLIYCLKIFVTDLRMLKKHRKEKWRREEKSYVKIRYK